MMVGHGRARQWPLRLVPPQTPRASAAQRVGARSPATRAASLRPRGGRTERRRHSWTCLRRSSPLTTRFFAWSGPGSRPPAARQIRRAGAEAAGYRSDACGVGQALRLPRAFMPFVCCRGAAASSGAWPIQPSTVPQDVGDRTPITAGALQRDDRARSAVHQGARCHALSGLPTHAPLGTDRPCRPGAEALSGA